MAENPVREPTQGRRRRAGGAALALVALVAGLAIGALLMGGLRLGSLFGGPNPESVATASLQAMREQARLVPFAASFVAVVTSSQERFGLRSEKTLIMPGTVRYEVDLAKLGQDDLTWDAESRTLRVTLPPVEVSQPQVDLSEVREYGAGGIVMVITGSEASLDSANRAAGERELMRQARSPVPLRLAREAARRAVERSFAMPMRAAGIDAQVVVRFPEEGTRDPSFIDHSRRVEEVLEERRKAAGR